MNIYKQDNYRTIYESYYGKIPYDDLGRPFDIHHKDGCHSNNKIENLQCVSMEEHFEIHCRQKDWQAAAACAIRLKKDKEIIKILQSLGYRERTAKNKHYNRKDYGLEDDKKWKMNNMADEYILYSFMK